MGAARLVVIEGPDVGCEFLVPDTGGGIGRGEGNVFQLSDLAVSREHSAIEKLDGQFVVIDKSSRNRTVVNGNPIGKYHVLQPGDEILIGKTRLSFLPVEAQASAPPVAARVTLEISSAQLRSVLGTKENRAERVLVALSELGQKLRAAETRQGLGAAACHALQAALGGERALLFERDGKKLLPVAAAIEGAHPGGTQISLPEDVLQAIYSERKALRIEQATQRALLAPLPAEDGTTAGILYMDRRVGTWDQTDLVALSATAQLVATAMLAFDARQNLLRENRELRDHVGGTELIGASPAFKHLCAFIAKVGPSDATVLLTGESGSGKEMVARAIHNASKRAHKPFVAMNCAALSPQLIESELFGHEKGAFTGATERKLGRFEAADGGTLFLDEVGELPADAQAKFLRVLAEQRFERVGGNQTISVSVRVIAATNRDLQTMVPNAFREDLYYRLSVIHTEVPPLRKRAEDIPILAEHFLKRLAAQVPRRITGFSKDALAALCSHNWPGNVRELKNAIERAVVLGDGEFVEAMDLPGSAAQSTTPVARAMGTASDAPEMIRSLRDLERDAIVATLAATGGNKARAAQLLEIDRSTLYKKLKDYGIEG
jgi:DNA-binding NtrC family response regulator